MIWRVPAVAVRLDATGLTPAQVLACVAPLLDGSDAAVWVDGLPDVLATGLEDPRVHRTGDGDPEASTYVVTVRQPGVLSGGPLSALITPPADGRGDETAVAPLVVRHVLTGRTLGNR